MNSFYKNIRLLHIGTALIFAVAILIVSFLLGDSDQRETNFLLMIGLYFVPMGIIEKLKYSEK